MGCRCSTSTVKSPVDSRFMGKRKDSDPSEAGGSELDDRVSPETGQAEINSAPTVICHPDVHDAVSKDGFLLPLEDQGLLPTDKPSPDPSLPQCEQPAEADSFQLDAEDGPQTTRKPRGKIDVIDHVSKVAVVSNNSKIIQMDVDSTVEKLCQITNATPENAWNALRSSHYEIDDAVAFLLASKELEDLCEKKTTKDVYKEGQQVPTGFPPGVYVASGRANGNALQPFPKDKFFDEGLQKIKKLARCQGGIAKGQVVYREQGKPGYSEIACNQAEILPPHLRYSTTASEILLESSIMGRYIMLPWNEEDKDIVGKFYLHGTPMRTATEVATHAQALPIMPIVCSSLSPPNRKTKGFLPSGFAQLTKSINVGEAFAGPNAPHGAGKTSNSHDNKDSGVDSDGWTNVSTWIDPDGAMTLSKKQQQKVYTWKRLSELTPDGCIFASRPSSTSIRQGFVGDCSFLSSLAVLADFEVRHGIQVLTGLLYPQIPHPQNSAAVIPVVNPRGMYACRLYFNGVPRKVLVDDFVPVRKDNKILSAHSSNSRESWVTLLEKSLLKLMGGSYYMQGSNPGADLYHLTAWIPETYAFRSDVHTGSPETRQPIVTGGPDDFGTALDPAWDKVWDQLYAGLVEGRCVACLGTSEVADAAPSGLEFPEGVSVSSGIVARHAYSILDFQQVGGTRLLYAKNPWGSIRWKGKYSPVDKQSWTPELSARLKYDQKREVANDTGTFWIEWSDVVRWFSHLYICWNNTYFPYQTEIHSKWDRTAMVGASSLADDCNLVAFNPQFHLEICPPHCSGVRDLPEDIELWILLSRHVRERERDLSEKYLAVHVHNGKERILCPPPHAKQGVYSNGECTLVKLSVGTRSPDALKSLECVLVVSQYSQKDEFNFTLKVYSHVETHLRQLPPLIPPSWSSTYYSGEWTRHTSGGCSNDLWPYFTNPHLRLTLARETEIIAFLECPQEHSVNLRIFTGRVATARILRTGPALSSGPYRPGCCVIRTILEAGDYTLIPSTFRPMEIAEYQLCVHANCSAEKIKIYPLPYPYAIPPMPCFHHYSTACGNSETLFKKQLLIKVHAHTLVAVRLQVTTIEPRTAWPSMLLYQTGESEQENSKRLKAGTYTPRNTSVLVCCSDLEGGLNTDGRKSSSAAQDLYQRQGAINITLVELYARNTPYVLQISSANDLPVYGAFEVHIISSKSLSVNDGRRL